MENGWAAWDLRAKEEFKFRVEKCPVILFIYIYIYIKPVAVIPVINQFFRCNNQ
jgi:hypothetical protein